uniref:Uncharacterized protein n=1 Tax=Anguilla anguilla TaxID=7936 RepID=A0A0E9QKQ3_ANGAN
MEKKKLVFKMYLYSILIHC